MKDFQEAEKSDRFLYVISIIGCMSETTFEKQVLKRLSHLEKEIGLIKERVVDDYILSEDDKEALDTALKEEKEGKLFTKDEVFD